MLHNLLIDYDKNDMPFKWYEEINDDIDWTLYDDEEEDIAEVTEEVEDRRKCVLNSVMNHFR